MLLAGTHWPAPGRGSGGIEIAYTAGYGPDADDAPEALRQAVREIVCASYERGAETAPGDGVRALLAPFRRVRL